MAADSNKLTLTLPRYVPFIIKGTVLAVWYDSHEDQYVVLCPTCHRLITCDTLGMVYHEMAWSDRKCCQGCRARISFERDPGLIGLFLDFWYRTGAFPQSTIWLEAIPGPQLTLWAKEIKAAVEAVPDRQEKFLAGSKARSNPAGQSDKSSVSS
jgi:hypothetical protein